MGGAEPVPGANRLKALRYTRLKSALPVGNASNSRSSLMKNLLRRDRLALCFKGGFLLTPFVSSSRLFFWVYLLLIARQAPPAIPSIQLGYIIHNMTMTELDNHVAIRLFFLFDIGGSVSVYSRHRVFVSRQIGAGVYHLSGAQRRSRIGTLICRIGRDFIQEQRTSVQKSSWVFVLSGEREDLSKSGCEDPGPLKRRC